MNLEVHVGDINYHGLAAVVHLLYGQADEVLSLVVGNLLTIHGEGLGEVAIAIEEAHCNHIYIRVGSLLDIVTSKNAKTTGVDLQDLVQTIFHAEISNAGAVLVRLYVHISAEFLIDIVHLLDDGLVLGEFFKTLEAETFKQHHRILAALLIEFGVEVCKE